MTEAPMTEAPMTEAPMTEAPAAGGGGAIAGLPAECVSPPYDIEIRRSGDGPNETFTVVDAEDDGANTFDRGGGALSYILWLTDYEIVDDESFFTQTFAEPPEGSTRIKLGLGRIEDTDDSTPIAEYPNVAAGEELLYGNAGRGPDEFTIDLQIASPEGGTSDVTVNPAVTGTVLYADDAFVCLDPTITSESGYQLSGVVTARVREF